MNALEKTLNTAIATTRTWTNLADHLHAQGVAFAPEGWGLVVKSIKTQTEICKLSALNLRYVDLIRHFGESFLNHPHQKRPERELTKAHTRHNTTQSQKTAVPKNNHKTKDEFDLIED